MLTAFRAPQNFQIRPGTFSFWPPKFSFRNFRALATAYLPKGVRSLPIETTFRSTGCSLGVWCFVQFLAVLIVWKKNWENWKESKTEIERKEKYKKKECGKELCSLLAAYIYLHCALVDWAILCLFTLSIPSVSLVHCNISCFYSCFATFISTCVFLWVFVHTISTRICLWCT